MTRFRKDCGHAFSATVNGKCTLCAQTVPSFLAISKAVGQRGVYSLNAEGETILDAGAMVAVAWDLAELARFRRMWDQMTKVASRERPSATARTLNGTNDNGGAA